MENKVSLGVPIAIVIAGIIVAGAIYVTNKNSSNATNQLAQAGAAQNTTVPTTDLTIRVVSPTDHIRGNPTAKVVVVEYSDPECPFCKMFQGTMKAVTDKLSKDGTMAWVYRNFPIKELHSKAPKEAEALLCAGKLGGNDGFWNFTDRVYAVTTSNDTLDPAKLPAIAKDIGLDVAKFNTCLSSGEMTAAVQADYDDATKSGGNGTPYSVLIASKPFDQKAVMDFLTKNMLQYGFPADLFAISSDNRRVSVSGAMPQQFTEDLIGILAK